MKVLLTKDMANELINNEDMIKKQVGPYRPQFNPVTKKYIPVIKCWPFEPFNGSFPQQRNVISGFESEIDDICFAKIENNNISYKVNSTTWNPPRTPYEHNVIPLGEYNILIYTPKFNNDTIFLTAETFKELIDKMEDYKMVRDIAYDESVSEDVLDKIFKKYQGICTYILLHGNEVIKCGN